jgi:hypothetical protein
MASVSKVKIIEIDISIAAKAETVIKNFTTFSKGFIEV